jgi:hypothetical protein
MDMASNSFFEQRHRGAADMPGTLTRSWVAGRLRLNARCVIALFRQLRHKALHATLVLPVIPAEAAGGELHR